MNFKQFTKLAESSENPVILLEGSRNVAEKDAESLTNLAVKLSKRFPQALFRSGGAVGSDDLFAQGVLQVNTRENAACFAQSTKGGFG